MTKTNGDRNPLVARFIGSWALLSLGTLAAWQPAAAMTDNGIEVSQVSVFEAIDRMSDDLQKNLPDLARQTNKTAIINFSQSEQLPPSTLNYLAKRLELSTQKNQSPVKFVQCLECLTLKAVTDGNDVVLKKGIGSDQELQATLANLGIKNYAEVNLAFSGQYLAMQMSVYDANKETTWAKEFRAPYRPHRQWTAGINLGAVGHLKSGLGMSSVATINIGQELYGVGSAGLNITAMADHPILGQINSFAGYVNFSHNDLFNTYWNSLDLDYITELGFTDFNGNQQILLGAGAKTTFGDIFTTQLGVRYHNFIQKPADDRAIENPDGQSIIRNDEPLPLQILLMTGFEFI